ncbi:unnamed protein product [Camellia sinensis]
MDTWASNHPLTQYKKKTSKPPFLLEISPTGAPGYFPKLLPAKFSCIYWVTHVGFKSPTPTMKMKTNFTTSKSKPHRPTGLTRTHDAGWIYIYLSDGIAITLFFTSLSALLSKLVIQSSASTVANPV